MKKAVLIALLSSFSIWAAKPDYFPLQVGNQWVLESSSTSPELLSIQVLRSRVHNGETYFLLSGYAPENRWVRQTSDGALLALNEKSGAEEVLAQLAPVSSGYKTTLSGCEQLATSAAAAAPYRSPHFTFQDVLPIAYLTPGCRDIGILTELYATGIGLARRSITTIRGETTFDLVYARVNGMPVVGDRKEVVLVHNFHAGSHGWLPGFTDYYLRTGDLRRVAEIRALPEEIDANRSAYFMQSMNRSDELFMFLKREVTSEDGIEPNQLYTIQYDIRFASNAASGCVGVGGSPGESVYLKAGGSTDEPLAVLENGDIRLSADKGRQADSGRDAGVTGTIANGRTCDQHSQYVRLHRTYAHPHVVRTDDRASLWLLIGTDLGYEGLTGLYYESVAVRIQASAVLERAPAGGGWLGPKRF
jgi:hypothetical protein